MISARIGVADSNRQGRWHQADLSTFTDQGIFTVTVKNGSIVKIEGAFEADALSVLRSVPGIEVVPLERLSNDVTADAVIHGMGSVHPVVVKFKRSANTAAAHQLLAFAERFPSDVALVLVASTSTKEARRLLEENGIGLIDGLGNAHIELPGLLLHLEPQHGRIAQKTEPAPPTRLAGKAGIIAQALLCDRQGHWTVADLAHRSSVSTGLTHRVLTRLEREGIVASRGAGPHRTREVRDHAALLDLWTEEASDRRVRRLRAFRLNRNPDDLADATSIALQQAGIGHAVTGPAVARRLAPSITAVPVTNIWISQRTELSDAANAAGAEPVETGYNLILAQAEADGPLVFRTELAGLMVVNRFRLYLDLLRDPGRGREQATRLREEVIGF